MGICLVYMDVIIVLGKSLKAHNLPISVSKTKTKNFCIVTSCKIMPMYEITISKSLANYGKRYLNIIKILPEDPLRIRKWYTIFKSREPIHKSYCHYLVYKD